MLIPIVIGYAGIAGLHVVAGMCVGDMFGGILILGSPIWPLMDGYFGFMATADYLHRKKAKKKRAWKYKDA